MSSGLLVAVCEYCGSEAYFSGGTSLTWVNTSSSSSSKNCEAHKPISPTVSNPSESVVSSSVGSGSGSGSGSESSTKTFEEKAGFENHFPTPNEAKYRMCLVHLQRLCENYIERYNNDLTNVSNESTRNLDEIEKQFETIREKLEQRKKELIDNIYNKKTERENTLTNLKEQLITYRERCSKGIRELWNTIQSQDETLEREQQCEEISRTIATKIPVIYEIPYQTKFEPKDMPRINTLVGGCGSIQSTEMDRKKEIKEFHWRSIDYEWLQPSSSLTSVPSKSRVSIETPKAEVNSRYHSENSFGNTVSYSTPRHMEYEEKHDKLENIPPHNTSNGYDEQDKSFENEIIETNGNNYNEEKETQMERKSSLGQSNGDDEDMAKLHVQYEDIKKVIAIPRSSLTLESLQRYVVEAFSLACPPGSVFFKAMDDGIEEELDLLSYNPNSQVIHVNVESMPIKSTPIGSKLTDSTTIVSTPPGSTSSEAAPTKPKKEKRTKLFINNNNKRAKYVLTNLQINYQEFRENIKTKIKDSKNDNFKIQITSGVNKNKFIESDQDMSLIRCGENQIELNIVR